MMQKGFFRPLDVQRYVEWAKKALKKNKYN